MTRKAIPFAVEIEVCTRYTIIVEAPDGDLAETVAIGLSPAAVRTRDAQPGAPKRTRTIVLAVREVSR